jgi:hypothetical protein
MASHGRSLGAQPLRATSATRCCSSTHLEPWVLVVTEAFGGTIHTYTHTYGTLPTGVGQMQVSATPLGRAGGSIWP